MSEEEKNNLEKDENGFPKWSIQSYHEDRPNTPTKNQEKKYLSDDDIDDIDINSIVGDIIKGAGDVLGSSLTDLVENSDCPCDHCDFVENCSDSSCPCHSCVHEARGEFDYCRTCKDAENARMKSTDMSFDEEDIRASIPFNQVKRIHGALKDLTNEEIIDIIDNDSKFITLGVFGIINELREHNNLIEKVVFKNDDYAIVSFSVDGFLPTYGVFFKHIVRGEETYSAFFPCIYNGINPHKKKLISIKDAEATGYKTNLASISEQASLVLDFYDEAENDSNVFLKDFGFIFVSAVQKLDSNGLVKAGRIKWTVSNESVKELLRLGDYPLSEKACFELYLNLPNMKDENKLKFILTFLRNVPSSRLSQMFKDKIIKVIDGKLCITINTGDSIFNS